MSYTAPSPEAPAASAVVLPATVEERIHKLQQEKGKLAAGILADAATVRALLNP